MGAPMNWFLDFYRSTVGKKVVMAVTGAMLVLFLVGHMLGNLQVYLGAEAYNHYAEALKALGAGLWAIRLGLLLILVVHLWSSFLLWRTSSNARPVGYKKWEPDASTYASRTMRWTGPIIAAYALFHILHLTVGVQQPWFDPHNVYGNVVRGFSNPLLSGIYIVSMLLLVFHLYHGAWSFLQSLGANHPRYNQWRKNFALVVTALIGLGFIAVPLGVLAGWVK
jgi:succinate dehydrogenase / fumarate reductase cytochrome b subunit